ncbi:MAG TPA: ABC transporter ATP-binding protein [Verrucomicrobiae bacterium]|nr:ABC transporter ATP-binding protein [Verrucomicrobiae bacterium]
MSDGVQNGSYVTARDLRRTYIMGKREVPVLRGVSIDVARGEFLALRGASGAGKSTLLHLLAGLDSPDGGEIRVAGTDLARMSQRELAHFRNEKVGLIFQAYHLLHELDALENVCLSGRIGGKSARALEKSGMELLARVGLKDRFDHRPYELSGGEQQRVAIARALINEPELIIADEPTGNLDSHTGEEIVDLLCALRNERNATLIIATHDNKVAERAPRVVRLVDGQVESSAAT